MSTRTSGGRTVAVELRCGCGYVAEGDDDATLVAAVQTHASEAHGVRLVSETIVRLAREAANEDFRVK